MKQEGKEARIAAIEAELAAMPARTEELRACADLADFLGRWDRYDASGKLREEETVQASRAVGDLKAILDLFMSEEPPERSKMVGAHLPEFITSAVSRNAKYYVALRALLNTRDDAESLPQFIRVVLDEWRELGKRQDELEVELYTLDPARRLRK